MVAVEGRDAWLGLLPEMMAICNEAARRQLKSNPTLPFDEPLVGGLLLRARGAGAGPAEGVYRAREEGRERLGLVRLHGFVVGEITGI